MIYIVDIIVNPIAVIATIVAIIVILITHRYVLFERSARQSLAWIKEEGDIYLNTHTQVLNTHILVGRTMLNIIIGEHLSGAAADFDLFMLILFMLIYVLMLNIQVGTTLEETEQLLAEHNSFKEKARETREKVATVLAN